MYTHHYNKLKIGQLIKLHSESNYWHYWYLRLIRIHKSEKYLTSIFEISLLEENASI